MNNAPAPSLRLKRLSSADEFEPALNLNVAGQDHGGHPQPAGLRRHRSPFLSAAKYLRLRRPWLVRKQLLADAASVKVAALTYGFWHLSDFFGSYRALFGELPSETLARAR